MIPVKLRKATRKADEAITALLNINKMSKDVDFVAASFIQTAEGVRQIKAYMEQCAKELAGEGKWELGHPLPLLISKIESVSGLNNFHDILDESDGISKLVIDNVLSCSVLSSVLLNPNKLIEMKWWLVETWV